MSIYHTLTPEQFDAIGQELDAIRNREIADLGMKLIASLAAKTNTTTRAYFLWLMLEEILVVRSFL